jgi:hypothetical protein
MAERRLGETASIEIVGAPAPGGDQRTLEWWWAGRLMALHGFPARRCPYRRVGEARRHWLAGFASGTRTRAALTARAA